MKCPDVSQQKFNFLIIFKESHSMFVWLSQVIILARECGLQLELGDIEIDKLLPESLSVSFPLVCEHHLVWWDLMWFKTWPIMFLNVNCLSGNRFCWRVLGETSKLWRRYRSSEERGRCGRGGTCCSFSPIPHQYSPNISFHIYLVHRLMVFIPLYRSCDL